MTEKLDVGLPDKLEFVNHGTHTEIIRRWFGPQAIFLTVFAVFWDGFLFFWYATAIASGDMMAMLFPLLHVTAGFFITYYSLASWFNRTYITASPGRISIRHTPIPWPGNIDLDAVNLKQLYTQEKVTRSKNGTQVTYTVHAITKDERNIKLLTGLESTEQALYIERQLEKYFGIRDVPVKGAIGG